MLRERYTKGLPEVIPANRVSLNVHHNGLRVFGNCFKKLSLQLPAYAVASKSFTKISLNKINLLPANCFTNRSVQTGGQYLNYFSHIILPATLYIAGKTGFTNYISTSVPSFKVAL